MTPRALAASDDVSRFATDAARLDAIRRRDSRAEGVFYYAVVTTGVFCRPTCPARPPRTENVRFYPTPAAAERAGYRPCKRCRPLEPPQHARHARVVEAARRLLASSVDSPALEALAARAGYSAHYFHRLFRAHVGMTPRQYAAALRLKRVNDGLREGVTVTAALHDAGYGSSGRFYEGAGALGMRPSAVRAGGRGVEIRAVVRECSLGRVLVAATERGVCAVAFGDDERELLEELRKQFPRAIFGRPDDGVLALAARVVEMIDQPDQARGVPLDLVGTAFQQAVWRVLRSIPAGTTLTYAEVARRIGAPRALRAVGAACGQNPVAVVVPCHRVVREDGALGGYRWGLDRKRALLERERPR